MKKLLACILSACLLSVALTGCGGEDTKTIRIYDGTFTESSLIHKMVELLVEEHTDAEVEILDQMAAVSNFKDLSSDKFPKAFPSTTTPTRLRKNSTRFTCWIRSAPTTPMPSL